MQLKSLDPNFIDKIMDRFRKGCGSIMMCDSLGIPRSVYYKWLTEGKKEDNEPFTSFRRRVMAAKANYLWSCVTSVKEAGEKSWQANAWLLERKDPQHYSEKFVRKRYPEELKSLPLDQQGDCIYGMMLNGKISQHEAHTFVEILAKIAQIDENVKLKQEIFEIKQKLEGK